MMIDAGRTGGLGLLFAAGLGLCVSPAVAQYDAIVGGGDEAEVAGTVLPPAEDAWWKDAVFYQIFVRSFADSTEGPLAGDGIGDLRGLIERLDYLNDGDPETTDDLGVTALWLLPINPSPSYHGYDVTDYKDINPQYGTLEDWDALVEACDARGIRIVLDLVINHASWEHPWFVEATDPRGDKHDWFVWTDARPQYRGPWGQPVWHDHRKDDAGRYFYGVFWHGMPDLNHRNADVRDAVYDASAFWMERGAGGFRLDAVKHLIEDGPTQENTPETVQWLKDYNAFLHGLSTPSFTVGEVWSGPAEIESYISGSMPAVDSAFDFPLSGAIVWGLRDNDYGRVRREAIASWERYRGRNSTFVSNHDMDRAFSVWERDFDKARSAAQVLLLLPGVPFIYYGEEIGMQGTGDHRNLRRPMQWTADPIRTGFTTGEPWLGVERDTALINVERQDRRRDSLLAQYRDLIQLRRSHPALGAGDFTPIEVEDDRVFAFVRSAEVDGAIRRLLCVINLSNDAVRGFELDAGALGVDHTDEGLGELLGDHRVRPPSRTGRWEPFPALKRSTAYVIALP
ncbi:MAG: alpha-amylase family glycosyl hydrolase [Planctomycetota bacterium]